MYGDKMQSMVPQYLDASMTAFRKNQQDVRSAFEGALGANPLAELTRRNRSEEHTSELQSLMRISYAVFCLKKKKKKYNTYNTTHTPRYNTRIHIDREYTQYIRNKQ